MFPIEEEVKESTRDLIILAIAERIASENTNTILVTNDNLLHKIGNESEKVSLGRARSLQSIFTLLSRDSKQVADLIQKFMPLMIKQKIMTITGADTVWEKLDIT